MSTTPLPSCGFAEVAKIHDNFNPHPFMITGEHVAYASQYAGGRLSADSITRSRQPCGMPGCNLKYSEHKSEKVAVIRITQKCTSKQVQGWMEKLISWAEAESVAGFAIIESRLLEIVQP